MHDGGQTVGLALIRTLHQPDHAWILLFEQQFSAQGEGHVHIDQLAVEIEPEQIRRMDAVARGRLECLIGWFDALDAVEPVVVVALIGRFPSHKTPVAMREPDGFNKPVDHCRRADRVIPDQANTGGCENALLESSDERRVVFIGIDRRIRKIGKVEAAMLVAFHRVAQLLERVDISVHRALTHMELPT